MSVGVAGEEGLADGKLPSLALAVPGWVPVSPCPVP